jgi:hypothetical protein
MVRNPNREVINNWRGLNTFSDVQDVDASTWISANNVLVNAKGNAEVLRSPKAFGNNFVIESSSESSPFSGESDPIVSMCEYARASAHALVIDHGESTFYLLAAGGEPTIVRVGNAGDPWTSLTINDRLHRVDGNEFIQILNDLTSVYRNGIDAPTIAPILTYSSNSDDTVISVSLQGSFCYRNSTTGHVSAPSPLSNVLGPSVGLQGVSFFVDASVQPGVDQIIFFLTVDGGNIPYLVLDCDTADMHTEANTTGTYTFDLSDITNDTLTPEPIYNNPPPTDASFMFEWKDRIVLIVDGGLQYSGFESCYIGQPAESWPALNQFNVPNKSDRAVGGISTQLGALVFGKVDSYLLSGYPSDKTSSPNNSLAVTEHMEPMNWRLGIKYPETAVNTPYGVIWVDQTNRIRNWNMQGFPIEIAQPLRDELDTMSGALKAKWFQHGKNGGYYVLTDGTKTLLVMLYLSTETGQLQFGYGKTDIAMEAISPCTFTTERFFYGAGDQTYEILNPTQAGDGWTEGTDISFQIIIGNDGNFCAFHSMMLEGQLNGLGVTCAAPQFDDEGTMTLDDEQPVILEDERDTSGSFYGLVDRENRRHLVTFRFDLDDRKLRVISKFQYFLKNKKRVI